MRPLLILAAGLCFATSGLASSTAKFRDEWAAAHGGTCNVRLTDGSRADVVTDKNVVDVVAAPRWPESIGRSLNQALQTGKRAGILVILQTEKERSYLERLRFVIGAHNLQIDVWSTGPGAEPSDAAR